ncbi:MAG: polysaccharide biosynthesis/export family protein [Pyrinomonadaceae bacterium]
MSIKSLIFAAILVSCALGLSAIAQESQNPVLGTTAGSIDNQGIRNYLLGPGDVLDVRVFGQSDLSSQVEIDADGNVSSLPFLETPIRAQCRTEKEVQRDIATAYAKYIKNPQVSVLVKERKSRQPATISGAVRSAMQVDMRRQVRLHELITKSGGWTDRASGTIQIMHTEPQMCRTEGEVFQTAALSEKGNFGMSIFKLNDLKLGKEEADPFIRPGDIVIVTEGEPVYVTGSVVTPRELVIRDQLTLGRAIAMAGGPQRLAKTSEVHIYRQKQGQAGQDDLKFNYDAIRKGKTPDVELKPFDIVDVGESSIFSGKGMGNMLRGLVQGSGGVILQRGVIF